MLAKVQRACRSRSVAQYRLHTALLSPFLPVVPLLFENHYSAVLLVTLVLLLWDSPRPCWPQYLSEELGMYSGVVSGS